MAARWSSHAHAVGSIFSMAALLVEPAFAPLFKSLGDHAFLKEGCSKAQSSAIRLFLAPGETRIDLPANSSLNTVI